MGLILLQCNHDHFARGHSMGEYRKDRERNRSIGVWAIPRASTGHRSNARLMYLRTLSHRRFLRSWHPCISSVPIICSKAMSYSQLEVTMCCMNIIQIGYFESNGALDYREKKTEKDISIFHLCININPKPLNILPNKCYRPPLSSSAGLSLSAPTPKIHTSM
jgi:hypothetical protein